MSGPSGGGRGTRTPDLYSAIVALSQLSYAPTGDAFEYTLQAVASSKRAASRRNICCPGRSCATVLLCCKHCAGVTQLVECLLPKQNVVGSSPITRSLSIVLESRPSRVGELSGFSILVVMLRATLPLCFRGTGSALLKFSGSVIRRRILLRAAVRCRTTGRRSCFALYWERQRDRSPGSPRTVGR